MTIRVSISLAALLLAAPAIAAEAPSCETQLATTQKQNQVLGFYLNGKSGELDLANLALTGAQARQVELQKQVDELKAREEERAKRKHYE